MPAVIYDPKYCKRCGGRLAVRDWQGGGCGFYEEDATFRCNCPPHDPKEQYKRRQEQEKEGK